MSYEHCATFDQLGVNVDTPERHARKGLKNLNSILTFITVFHIAVSPSKAIKLSSPIARPQLRIRQLQGTG